MRKLLLIPAALSISLAGLVLVGGEGCKHPATAADVEAGAGVANGICSLIEGVTQNQTVISICATVEEVGLIASLVSGFLRSGPDAGGSACSALPGRPETCLTASQKGSGIQAVLVRRRARLVLDAGVAP